MPGAQHIRIRQQEGEWREPEPRSHKAVWFMIGYFGVKLEGTGEFDTEVKYDLIYALKADGRQGLQASYNGEYEHVGAL